MKKIHFRPDPDIDMKYKYLCADIVKNGKTLTKYVYRIPISSDYTIEEKVEFAKDFNEVLEDSISKKAEIKTYDIPYTEYVRTMGNYKFIDPKDMRDLRERVKKEHEEFLKRYNLPSRAH